MPKRLIALLCFGLLAFVMQSCRPTKHLAEGEYLLTKVKVNVHGSNLDQDDVHQIIKQHPNRKIFLFFRVPLGLYNMVDQERLNRRVARRKSKLEAKNETRAERDKLPKNYRRTIGEWMVEDVGRPPVVYNEELTKKSTKQLNQYLQNKGFFNGHVTDSVYLKKKKAVVHYDIKAGKPYAIRRIKFAIDDTLLINPIKIVSKRTLLAPGDNCDVDVIEEERARIEKAMHNQGYYRFSREYVYFEIDSNLNQHKLDIKQIVKNPMVPSASNPDSLMESRHKVYYICNIYVNANYNPKKQMIYKDTVCYKDIQFVGMENSKFRTDVLEKSIFINAGDIYRLKNVEYTNSRLAALKTFRFVNISFEETEVVEGYGMLDCYINLVPLARHSIVTEVESTTNRIAPFGISGGIVYKNKNTFKGAEILEVKLSGGMQAQKQLTSTATSTPQRFLNTLEFGPEVSLNKPGFILPKRVGEYFLVNDPKTSFSVAYNHQTRLDYTRNVAITKMSYSWRSSTYHTHKFNPIDLNVVRIDKTAYFQQQLLATKNRYLINTYQNHLIASSNYTFIYNNQDINKFKNFNYFMFNIEGTGNLLRGIFNTTNAEKNSRGGYELFGIQFAQYIKPEVDFRMYRVVNKNSNMVYRLFAGIGIPLSNLDVLPFEKSYFAGGANGIRAWTARTLGPGTLSDTASTAVDRIGDMQLEGNVEYRFSIIDILKGTAFVDFGNIWLRNYDANRPGGQFKFNDFYKATAIGAGLGARFDFSFLIIRLDAAIPIKDPSLIEGERWIFQSKTETNNAREIYYGTNYTKYRPKVNLNFGIGYPF